MRAARSLDALPDAILILDAECRVVLANLAAQRLWQRGSAQMSGQDVHLLMNELRWPGTGAPMLPRAALQQSLQPIAGEGEDAQGRALLLRCAPLFEADDLHAGWALMLVDVSPMRRAEQQRDEALRFLSHDARTSGATILGMIELARARPESFTGDALLRGIEEQAQAGLDRSDGFVHLARAQVQPLRAEMLDLVALLQQAVDSAWTRARKRRTPVRVLTSLDEAPCLADRGLLTRALAHLLANALEVAAPGAQLACSLAGDEKTRQWRISVPDHGPGATGELQSHALLLARTVAQRHGGDLEIVSGAAGCTVALCLPRPCAAELDAPASRKE